MKELKQALRKLVESQPLLASILPAAAVLVLIDPVLMLINSFSGMLFYYQTAGLFFVVYLLGLGLCMAADNDWAVGLAFALKAVASLVSFVNYATFSRLVYVALYGVLAFFFLRDFFRSEQGQRLVGSVSRAAQSRGGSADYSGGPAYGATGYPGGNAAGNGTVTCGNCGLTVAEGGTFCPRCGAPLPQPAAPEQPTERFCPRCGRKLEPGARFCAYCGPEAGPVEPPTSGGAFGGFNSSRGSYNGVSPVGELTNFCTGGIFLVFTAVLTLKLACSVVLQFNIFSVIAAIPSIVLCVGLWEVWMDSNKGRLRSNGFRLASGALLAELIIACIPLVLLAILSLIVMSGGEEAIAVGLILLVAVVVAFLILRLYWFGLRRTAKSAAAVADGQGRRVEATLFPIVMLFISGALALISLVSLASMGSILSGLMSEIQYYINSYAYMYGIDASVLSSLLSALTPDWKTYIVQLLSAASPICAALMLISVRNTWPDR
ncbi:MAG: zinc-ribbon domain-containing protein [Clostridiales bacterium]|nr:zinc-ribbon domain-containing protein [Clostridiales bacterium]